MKESVSTIATEQADPYTDVDMPEWLFHEIRVQTISFFSMPLEMRQSVYDAIADQIFEPMDQAVPDSTPGPQVSPAVQRLPLFFSILASNKVLRDELLNQFSCRINKEWLSCHKFVFEDCIELASFVSIIPKERWSYIQGKLTVDHTRISHLGPFPCLRVDGPDVHLMCLRTQRNRLECRDCGRAYLVSWISRKRNKLFGKMFHKLCGEGQVEWVQHLSYADGTRGKIKFTVNMEDWDNRYFIMDGHFTRPAFFRTLLVYGLWQKHIDGRTFHQLYDDRTVSGLNFVFQRLNNSFRCSGCLAARQSRTKSAYARRLNGALSQISRKSDRQHDQYVIFWIGN